MFHLSMFLKSRLVISEVKRYWRYIRTIVRSSKEEAEVPKQFHENVFMKTHIFKTAFFEP